MVAQGCAIKKRHWNLSITTTPPSSSVPTIVSIFSVIKRAFLTTTAFSFRFKVLLPPLLSLSWFLVENKYVFLDINENDDVILLRTLSSGIEVLSCILFSTSLILDCC